MHHEMLRTGQALTETRVREILDTGLYGTLALCGADGMPYAVPLNYCVEGNKLWFLCATQGHKLELLRENPKVSFCVVGFAQAVPEDYTTRFESVILFGRARVLETREEKLAAMTVFCQKYSPQYMDRLTCMRGDLKGLCMVELEIERVTGKRSLD